MVSQSLDVSTVIRLVDHDVTVERLLDALRCAICRDVLKDGVQLARCQHAFCRHCLRMMFAFGHRLCPLDRQTCSPRDVRPLPALVRAVISAITVSCPHQDCTHTTCTLDHLVTHLSTAPHSPGDNTTTLNTCRECCCLKVSGQVSNQVSGQVSDQVSGQVSGQENGQVNGHVEPHDCLRALRHLVEELRRENEWLRSAGGQRQAVEDSEEDVVDSGQSRPASRHDEQEDSSSIWTSLWPVQFQEYGWGFDWVPSTDRPSLPIAMMFAMAETTLVMMAIVLKLHQQRYE